MLVVRRNRRANSVSKSTVRRDSNPGGIRRRTAVAVCVAVSCLVVTLGVWRVRQLYFFPSSDVPVVTSVDFWPYQDCIEIDRLDVRVLASRFGLMNTGEALLEVTIGGSITPDSPGRSLSVSSVQVTERVSGSGDERHVDIELVPVCSDAAAEIGLTGRFDVRLEYVVHAFQWGPNRFSLHSGQASTQVEVLCPK